MRAYQFLKWVKYLFFLKISEGKKPLLIHKMSQIGWKQWAVECIFTLQNEFLSILPSYSWNDMIHWWRIRDMRIINALTCHQDSSKSGRTLPWCHQWQGRVYYAVIHWTLYCLYQSVCWTWQDHLALLFVLSVLGETSLRKKHWCLLL